jgi:hypothetical protein
MAIREGKIRGKRWQLLVGSVALGAAALGLAGSGVASSTASADEAPSSTMIVQCSSGTITQGDVQTSSLSVTRVPASEHPDLPGGCSVLTG